MNRGIESSIPRSEAGASFRMNVGRFIAGEGCGASLLHAAIRSSIERSLFFLCALFSIMSNDRGVIFAFVLFRRTTSPCMVRLPNLCNSRDERLLMHFSSDAGLNRWKLLASPSVGSLPLPPNGLPMLIRLGPVAGNSAFLPVNAALKSVALERPPRPAFSSSSFPCS